MAHIDLLRSPRRIRHRFTRTQPDTKQRELVTETPPAFTLQVARQVPPLGSEFWVRAMIFGKAKRAWLQRPGKAREIGDRPRFPTEKQKNGSENGVCPQLVVPLSKFSGTQLRGQS